jgi:hypothetical protein
VYLHFGNRATLLAEMARRIDRTSGFTQRVAATRELPSRPALRRLLEEWYAYIPTILATHRALEAAAVTGSDGTQAYFDRMTDWRDGIRLALDRLHADGQLSARWGVDAATDWVWAHVHPTSYHHLVGERGWKPGDVARRTIEALERELLLPPPGAAAPPPAAPSSASPRRPPQRGRASRSRSQNRSR